MKSIILFAILLSFLVIVNCDDSTSGQKKNKKSAHRQEKEEIDKELDEIHEFVENECKSGGADMSKTQRRTLKMMASVLGIECHLKKRSKNHHGKKHHGNDRDNDNDKEDEQKKLEELDS